LTKVMYQQPKAHEAPLVAVQVPTATARPAPVTSQPTVVVGQVVSVSPVMPTFGSLQIFEGVVLTEKQRWPFPMCCASCPCAHLCKDPGLCCYACWLPTCLAAEISAKIGNKGCCSTEECCQQWCAAWGCSLLAGLFGIVLCGFGALSSLCVWITVLSQTRDAQKAVYQLPNDELCCQNSCTNFLPLPFCDCTTSALYQQAYYLKYAQQSDFECCCYKCICAWSRPDDRLADNNHNAALLA